MSYTPDLSAIQGLSLTPEGHILVAGGSTSSNGQDDRYLLRFDLQCNGGACSGGQMPNDMSLIAAVDINTVLGQTTRVGGVAVDLSNNKAYVAELQTDPSSSAVVVPVNLNSNGLALETKLEIPLGQVGAKGFDGLAHNSESGTLYGSVGPDQQGNPGFMEFDTSGFPLSTSWTDNSNNG